MRDPFVEGLSISESYDRLVLNGLATAGTLTAGTVGDVITKVRRGISQLANAGYAADNPDHRRRRATSST